MVQVPAGTKVVSFEPTGAGGSAAVMFCCPVHPDRLHARHFEDLIESSHEADEEEDEDNNDEEEEEEDEGDEDSSADSGAEDAEGSSKKSPPKGIYSRKSIN